MDQDCGKITVTSQIEAHGRQPSFSTIERIEDSPDDGGFNGENGEAVCACAKVG